MRKFFLSLLSAFVFLGLQAQDNYHQELLTQLQTEYGLENPSYVLSDQELNNLDGTYIYGDATRQVSAVAGSTFQRKLLVKNNSVGNNPWDAGMGILNNANIAQGDVCLMVFWGRKISATSDVALFIEDAGNFEKEVYASFNFQPDWTQYFVAFESSKNYNGNSLAFGLHLASAVQEFDIAGLTVLNFKDQYSLDDVPSIFSPGNYEGNEVDAPWRAEAASRIENLRKANLQIKVVDPAGNPVEGASIMVEMQEHDFGFGSAFVTCRFPGNNCYNATYVEKISDLDGQGHGFNVGVTENALKWDAWEEQWLGTPEETISAIQQLSDLGIKMRGHTLVWPGWNVLPDDLFDNRNDIEYLKNRINSRIGSMLTNPELSGLIDEWDVINEFTFNRDLEDAFKGSLGYPTGREIYRDIFDKTTELAPNNKNYINDYVTLSNGGFGLGTINQYKGFIQEVVDGGSKLDGIGFQCHIGTSPTSILKVENTLNEFYDQFNVPMKITEYDIDNNVDEDTQAKYLGDFMTMIFSHPGIEAFLMWGFWDGNHWKSNAPMFDINWNIKPSGQRFIDLVFGEWWTLEDGLSDAAGDFPVRAFKGEHLITISKDGLSETLTTYLTEDKEVVIVLDGINSSKEIAASLFKLAPNPSNGHFRIDFPPSVEQAEVQVYDNLGRRVATLPQVANHETIRLELPAGIYWVRIQTESGLGSKRIVIR